MQGRVREWRWECGEMEKRVREVRSEEVRLRGALEQREREAIAHLREVSWKYVSKSGLVVSRCKGWTCYTCLCLVAEK